jgi:hypothetical protein
MPDIAGNLLRAGDAFRNSSWPTDVIILRMTPAGYVDSDFGIVGVISDQLGNGYSGVFVGPTVEDIFRRSDMRC